MVDADNIVPNYGKHGSANDQQRGRQRGSCENNCKSGFSEYRKKIIRNLFANNSAAGKVKAIDFDVWLQNADASRGCTKEQYPTDKSRPSKCEFIFA